MPDAGAIRAGGAYVELSADETRLIEGLQRSQARLRQWVEENQWAINSRTGKIAQSMAQPFGETGGEKGFFGGSFRESTVMGAMRLHTAVLATKAVIADVRMFSSLFQGDMEGARKAAESLPLGLGEIVKELSGPVDAAMKALVFHLKGITDDAYDPAATARAEKERVAAAKAFNEGNKAIAETQKALDRATMSAEEFAKAEVEGMNLGADQAQRLLDLKLRLIKIDEQRKDFARRQAVLDRGEGLLGQAMDQYVKLTMSEKEFIAYEVKHMGLAANHAQSLLSWKLAILDVTGKQAEAEKRQRIDQAIGETVEVVQTRIRELKGSIDALQAEEERAMRPINEAVDAGTLSFREAAEQVDRIKKVYGELRQAQQAADTKKEAERLTEAMRTPEEKAKAEIARAKELLAGSAITKETYDRAVRSALEEAARSLPDATRRTVGVRGTFNAMEAAGLGAGGVADRIAQATEKTARNTEKIAQVAKDLGVSFN